MNCSHLDEVKTLLSKFDAEWCFYEQAYIGELIMIEHDARRYMAALKQSVGDDSAFIEAI